mgnify:CR=1|jgi:small subunit ribosomal protein S14
MTQSDHKKMLAQLKVKKPKHGKFIKHNAPKERKHGIAKFCCKICGARRGFIKSYGLNLCRKCFRDIATEIGFKKYD